MLSPDGVVLHALPGFWHAQDLAVEMKLAMNLWAVWKNKDMTRAQKDALFSATQIDAWKNASKATTLRSRWQGFDKRNEEKRAALGIERDTVKGAPIQKPLNAEEQAKVEAKMAGLKNLDREVQPLELKPINQLVHERMSVRPFVPYEKFDVAAFADYGRSYYDNNKKVDGEGSTLMTPREVQKQEQRAKRREMNEKKRNQRRVRN
jgi:hypothetical protein